MAIGSKTVLVLGAGINGCAIARELLLCGASVWIVEAADVACGATAGSSRLIHGGLRYLEYGEFDLVKESLAERTRLLRLAPQFVHPLRLFIPATTRLGGTLSSTGRFFGWSWWPWPVPKGGRGVWLIRAGLAMYDAYARDSTLPKHQVASTPDADAPPVDSHKYPWVCSYYDAQVPYPERMVLALLEDCRMLAEEQGLDFRLLNYHQATLRDDVVEIRSARADTVTEMRPSTIVNATGAWVDETLERLHVPSRRLMGGTKGSHLFTFNSRLRDALAGKGIYAEAEDGRPIFITPLADTVLIGTTDVPIEGPPDSAVMTDRERDYLLESVNAILPEVRLRAIDIDFHTSAVRPLPYVPAASPAAVTRRHSLVKHDGTKVPLISVVGGKLTTMRALAELTVTTVLEQWCAEPTANSRQRAIPGGEEYPADAAAVEAAQEAIADRVGLSRASIAAVWRLCGTRCESILTSSPQRDMLPDTDLPLSFARWTIRHEWAMSLADLVERRLMLLYHQRLTRACLESLGRLLSEEGRLPAAEIKGAVSAEVERLVTRYGKQVI